MTEQSDPVILLKAELYDLKTKLEGLEKNSEAMLAFFIERSGISNDTKYDNVNELLLAIADKFVVDEVEE